jgi:hypothetical protein
MKDKMISEIKDSGQESNRIKAAKQRLAQSKAEYLNSLLPEYIEYGRDWALDLASYDQLMSLQKFVQEEGDLDELDPWKHLENIAGLTCTPASVYGRDYVDDIDAVYAFIEGAMKAFEELDI